MRLTNGIPSLSVVRLFIVLMVAAPAHAADSWKLMGPPVRFKLDPDFDKGRQQAQDIARRDASVDVKADVVRWQPIATFDTRSECVAATLTMRELLNLSEDTYRLLETESGSLLTYEAFLLALHHARCFSFAELRALGFVVTPTGAYHPASSKPPGRERGPQ